MLKSTTDRRYEYSRIAALESSRDMINDYHCIRHPDRPLVAVCNVIDFQVFTAAMLLTIHLLGNPDSPSTASSNDSSISPNEQNNRDWNLIHGLISDLQLVVKGGRSRGTSTVAAQALTVLSDLSHAKNNTESHAPNDSYQAIIPYFGKIRIRWGKAFRARQMSSSSSSAATNTTTYPNTHATNTNANTPSSTINQMPTPSSLDSSAMGTPNISNGFLANDTDPKISFDSFFQPLPGEEGQPWGDMGVDWNAMNGFELLNDWNWFAGGLQSHTQT
ncbi:MAG: hypothetical protein Q9198_009306 [Flavoplaca austrocitrina]